MRSPLERTGWPRGSAPRLAAQLARRRAAVCSPLIVGRLFSKVVRPGNPTQRTPQVAAVPEGIMSNTEQNKSEETGKHELNEDTDRPAGTVDEDANPPLTDATKSDVDRSPKTVPPQDTGSAVPPYEGRT
jgi:hypothetical protein